MWLKLKGYAIMAGAIIVALGVAFFSGWRKGSSGKEDELEREYLEREYLEQELQRQQEGHRQVVQAVEDRQEVQDAVDTAAPADNRQALRDRWGS